MCLKTDFKDGKTVRVVTVPWARLRKTRGYLAETNSCYSKSSIGGASQYGKDYNVKKLERDGSARLSRDLKVRSRILKINATFYRKPVSCVTCH